MSTVPLSNIVAYLKDLHTGKIEQTAQKTITTLAQLVTNQVKARYYEFNKPPRGVSLTILTRGKEIGPLSNRPARVGLGAESVMGRLARNVVLTHIAKKHKRVEINPAALHPHGSLKWPGGVPLSLIAWWQENRISQTMPMTILMNAYLQMMLDKRGGFGERKTSKYIKTNRPLRGSVVITPPDRPVWKYVIENLKKIEKDLYIKAAKD